MGPPRVKPYCCWEKGYLSASEPSAFLGGEARASSLKNACTVPWKSLVPDLVTTLTKPPLERPNSAFAPWATTTTSCTASRLKVKAGR